MQSFLKVYVSLVFVFSWLPPAEAASALSDDSPFGPSLKGSKHAVSFELKKPKGMAALAWLSQLEEKRDTAELDHDYAAFREISQEISATLAGKYGLKKRRAKPQERQRMISSIIRTRHHFAGMPNILSQLYFNHNPVGCWKKVKKDPVYAKHMGVILAVNTIQWGLTTDGPFYREGRIDPLQTRQAAFKELFTRQRQKPRIEKRFIQTVGQMAVDIHDSDRPKTLITTLSQKNWKKLVTHVGEINDVLAPRANFLDIYTGDFSAFEDHGWQSHKAGQFSIWLRKGDDNLKSAKQAFIEGLYRIPKKFGNFVKALLQPMTPRAVLLTAETKQYFLEMPKDVPFDGTVLAIEYRFFPPALRTRAGGVIPRPISFYITREWSGSLSTSLLSPMDTAIVQKRAQNYKDVVSLLNRLYFGNNYKVKLDPSIKMNLWKKAANLGSLVAYNNFGVYLEEKGEKEEKEAEQSYQVAADQGFSPAIRNYGFLLRRQKAEPRQIRLYMNMAGLLGEFSTPANGFAAGLFYEPPSLEEMFENVRFTPQPHCIKLKNQITVIGGDLEIHFRDSTHLRSLIEQTPHVVAKRLYFVLDKEVSEGKEFIATSGALTEERFIHVMADEPLTPEGKLNSPYSMILPKGSDINRLLAYVRGGISTGLTHYTQALYLATTLENFDERVLQTKTTEAKALFEARRQDRLSHPERYPSLSQLAPHACICADNPIEIRQNDFLHGQSHIAYVGPSLPLIREIETQLKPFGTSDYIFFINPFADISGIYSDNNLEVVKYFEVMTSGNLLLAGNIELLEHGISITAKGKLWGCGIKLFTNYSAGITARYDLDIVPLLHYQTKPADMPLEMWNGFKAFVFSRYGVLLGE